MPKPLKPSQQDQIRNWLRMGYTPQEIEELSRKNGWSVSSQHIYKKFLPELKEEMSDHLREKSIRKDWFDREFRAEKAAEMAEMLYQKIMAGELFSEEVTERDGYKGKETTVKKVYFAGMIKNWKDLVDTIANETGQRKKIVDLNYNKNQNLNISFLIDKILDEDEAVSKQIEGAEIIDIPSDTDFSDDEGYFDIVDEQTDDEIKGLIAPEEDDGYPVFPE